MLRLDASEGTGVAIEFVRADPSVTRRVEPDGEKASERKQIVATPRWVKRIDDWRSSQRPIPTWSDAVRVLVEEALDARERSNGKR